ncbi:hypothetical protein RvY_04423 [Ramazzottius varieornatus]|uniref:Uncharacterized protein n=1 Tax=Ramazzottius varieornatus TaxID=947166 RepID=A0A1D1UYD3_RAMVA|nr:hypothetical protein RvY_04423 [Ramazzottius varieornatus]
MSDLSGNSGGKAAENGDNGHTKDNFTKPASVPVRTSPRNRQKIPMIGENEALEEKRLRFFLLNHKDHAEKRWVIIKADADFTFAIRDTFQIFETLKKKMELLQENEANGDYGEFFVIGTELLSDDVAIGGDVIRDEPEDNEALGPLHLRQMASLGKE